MLDTTNRWRPSAPVPHVEPPKLIALLKTVRRNPLETWTRTHFEEPVVINRVAFGEVAVVSAPAAIRHVLVDNVANYRKDNLQRRMLASLSSGILTAEGDDWAAQRRMFAPIFTAKTVKRFAPAMMDAVAALRERWRNGYGQAPDGLAAAPDHAAAGRGPPHAGAQKSAANIENGQGRQWRR